MASASVSQARAFVTGAELPAPPAIERSAGRATPIEFDPSKTQAAVVGSEVISFATGVTEQQRKDVTNAVLLAQLIAKRKVPAPGSSADIQAWYAAYFDALSSIGFAVQDHGFTRYQKKGSSFEVHEGILEVAAVLLAGAPAALALVQTTLKALQSMSEDSPWITLFERESQSANTARFQVSAVEGDERTGFFISILAFGLEAQSELTQVLFFKFHSDDMTLFHQGGRVSINEQVLASVREPIAAKLTVFATDFIKMLPDDLAVPRGGTRGGGTLGGGGTDFRWPESERERPVERNYNIIVPPAGGGEWDI